MHPVKQFVKDTLSSFIVDTRDLSTSHYQEMVASDYYKIAVVLGDLDLVNYDKHSAGSDRYTLSCVMRDVLTLKDPAFEDKEFYLSGDL